MSRTELGSGEQKANQSISNPSSFSSSAVENVALVQSLAIAESHLPAPINLSLDRAQQITVDRLRWENDDTEPNCINLTNTGELVILSGQWPAGKRPSVGGGPLANRRYTFSQLHFHWGRTALEGSEHTVNGSRMPLEVHAMYFDERVGDPEAAGHVPGGTLCVVYFFRLQPSDSHSFAPIAAGLERVLLPGSHTQLDPFPLDALVHTFRDDYFLYWGSVREPEPSRAPVPILWMVSRTPERLSFTQLKHFNRLLDRRMRPIKPSLTPTVAPPGRHLFHVNPRTPAVTTRALRCEPPSRNTPSSP